MNGINLDVGCDGEEMIAGTSASYAIHWDRKSDILSRGSKTTFSCCCFYSLPWEPWLLDSWHSLYTKGEPCLYSISSHTRGLPNLAIMILTHAWRREALFEVILSWL